MVVPPRYAILESLNDSVLVINRDYSIAFANHHFLQLCTTSADKIIGEKCYQVLHHSPFPCAQGHLPSSQCVHKQVFDTGRAVRVAHYHELPAGGKIFLEISASPLKDEQGNITQVITIIRDDSAHGEVREKGLMGILEEEEAIFRNAPFSLTYLDRDMRVIKINTKMEELVGFSLAEVKGRHCYELWGQYAQDASRHGREKICDTCEVDRAVSHGQTCIHERQVGGKYLLVTTSPVRDKAGVIVGTLECGQDITERKEMEEEVARQKVWLETIVNALPDIVCLKDGAGRWLLANDFALELFGLSAVAYQGKTDAELAVHAPFYQEAFSRCQATDDEAWNQREAVRGEEIVPRPGEEPYVFDVVKIPLFSMGGDRSSLVVAGRDITALRLALRQVGHAKEEWERTFNAMADIITIQDKDLRIVRANKSAYDFFEVGPGELEGKHCYKIFRDSNEPCQNCPIVKTLTEIANHSEIIHHPNLGKIFQVSSSVIFDSNGDFEYLVHIARDITHQKQLEEELSQAQKMEAIGTLAGGVAHDFNNILSAIVGYAELAKMAIAEDSQAAADLGEVLQATQRASDLVKQILTFSRKEAHEREALEPYLLVKEALKLMRASLPATVKIVEDIDPGSGAILADPTKIHQIVVNLCTNALHALEEESGEITVTVKRRELGSHEVAGHSKVAPGEFVELTVSDNGCGMSAQVKQRIFEPYYTTKATGKGTGLGLAVVLGIVQDYGGLIKVESQLGKGTAFHAFFPVIDVEVARAVAEEEEAILPLGTERILTVDDERAIIELHKTTLSRLGYRVTAKSGGEEALELFRNDPQGFDLLITDQAMPNLSGKRLAEEVLRLRPDLPIILCTGYSAVLSKQEALEMGIKRYLGKPVAMHDLARVVREVLDG